ncbi:ankyrin repeat-containing domain protein [Aspergillus venezuelensis]
MAHNENPTVERSVKHDEPDEQTPEPNLVQENEDDVLNNLIIATIKKQDRKSLEELIKQKRDERADTFIEQSNFEFPWGGDEDIPGTVTPLMVASMLGRDRLVDRLLSGNANYRAVDDDGNTALHLASMWGTREVVESLLEKNMDLRDAGNHAGETPLHVACLKSNFPTADCLIQSG